MILMQHWFGPVDQGMLDIAEPWHRIWCQGHGVQYVVCHDNIRPDLPQYWAKFEMIVQASKTAQRDELLMFLDHDTLIVGDELPTLMPQSHCGCVRSNWGTLNFGVMIVKNKSMIIDYLQMCLDKGEKDLQPAEQYHEESRFLREQEHCPLRIETLDSRWNHWVNPFVKSWGEPMPPIQIEAWHAKDRQSARRQMQEMVDKL